MVSGGGVRGPAARAYTTPLPSVAAATSEGCASPPRASGCRSWPALPELMQNTLPVASVRLVSPRGPPSVKRRLPSAASVATAIVSGEALPREGAAQWHWGVDGSTGSVQSKCSELGPRSGDPSYSPTTTCQHGHTAGQAAVGRQMRRSSLRIPAAAAEGARAAGWGALQR